MIFDIFPIGEHYYNVMNEVGITSQMLVSYIFCISLGCWAIVRCNIEHCTHVISEISEIMHY